MNRFRTDTSAHHTHRDPAGFSTADLLAIVDANPPAPFVGYTLNSPTYFRLRCQSHAQEFVDAEDASKHGFFHGYFGGLLVYEAPLQKDDAIEWHDRDEMRAYLRITEAL
jgi:hypothetical protein